MESHHKQILKDGSDLFLFQVTSIDLRSDSTLQNALQQLLNDCFGSSGVDIGLGKNSIWTLGYKFDLNGNRSLVSALQYVIDDQTIDPAEQRSIWNVCVKSGLQNLGIGEKTLFYALPTSQPTINISSLGVIELINLDHDLPQKPLHQQFQTAYMILNSIRDKVFKGEANVIVLNKFPNTNALLSFPVSLRVVIKKSNGAYVEPGQLLKIFKLYSKRNFMITDFVKGANGEIICICKCLPRINDVDFGQRCLDFNRETLNFCYNTVDTSTFFTYIRCDPRLFGELQSIGGLFKQIVNPALFSSRFDSCPIFIMMFESDVKYEKVLDVCLADKPFLLLDQNLNVLCITDHPNLGDLLTLVTSKSIDELSQDRSTSQAVNVENFVLPFSIPKELFIAYATVFIQNKMSCLVNTALGCNANKQEFSCILFRSSSKPLQTNANVEFFTDMTLEYALDLWQTNNSAINDDLQVKVYKPTIKQLKSYLYKPNETGGSFKTFASAQDKVLVQDKVFEGTDKYVPIPDNIDKTLTWHVHPNYCFSKNKFMLNWPSYVDVRALSNWSSFKNGPKVHLLSSLEGIYTIRINKAFKNYLSSLNTSCLGFILTLIENYFLKLAHLSSFGNFDHNLLSINSFFEFEILNDATFKPKLESVLQGLHDQIQQSTDMACFRLGQDFGELLQYIGSKYISKVNTINLAELANENGPLYALLDTQKTVTENAFLLKNLKGCLYSQNKDITMFNIQFYNWSYLESQPFVIL